jgi:hypothetical protein
MDGMARPCGVDIPDGEGEPHTHAGILPNAGGSVKPCGAVCVTGENSGNSGNSEMGGTGERCETTRETRDMRDSRFRRFIEFCQSRFSRLARVSRYSPDAAAIVKRIVPIRLISLICSPT